MSGAAPVSAQARAVASQQLLQQDIVVKKLVLDVVQRHLPGIRVDESIITGEVNRTIAGASEVILTLHDPRRIIVNTPSFYDDNGELRAIDILIDNLVFRLVKQNKQGDDIVLTFETRAVSRLRAKMGPRKAASRANTTRAEYIYQLIRSIKADKIPVDFHGQLHTVFPVAKLTDSERSSGKKRKTKDASRAPGFDEGTQVGGLGKGQLDNVDVALGVALDVGATERPILAMIMAGFGESNWKKTAAEKVYNTHKGVFQSDQIPANDLEAQARHFLIGGRSFIAGGAIKVCKDHPDWTLGQVVQAVEISDGSSQYYDSFRTKTFAVWKAWSGSADKVSTEVSYTKRAEFKVDKKENYWDAIQRMASQVNRVAFFSGETFHYIDEQTLYESRARYRVSERSPGVSNIDFDNDSRKKVVKATITCRIDRWAIPPGTTVVIEDLGGANGKWLVESINRSLFSAEATVTLKKPMRPKLEPRTDQVTKGGSGNTSGADAKRGLVVGDLVGLNRDLREFLELVAGQTSEKIVISAGMQNHATTTKDGNRSNHADGYAADIDCVGDAHYNASTRRRGDNICIAVLKVCGYSYRDAQKLIGIEKAHTNFSIDSEWNGWQVEIGWLTAVGGNHYTHVHVGFDNRKSSSGSNKTSQPTAKAPVTKPKPNPSSGSSGTGTKLAPGDWYGEDGKVHHTKTTPTPKPSTVDTPATKERIKANP